MQKGVLIPDSMTTENDSSPANCALSLAICCATGEVPAEAVGRARLIWMRGMPNAANTAHAVNSTNARRRWRSMNRQ